MIILAAPDVEFALSLAAKATIVLASAAVAHLALRRASAATRHLLWVLALGSLAVLPAVSLALPGWSLPVDGLRPGERLQPSGGAEPGGPLTYARGAGEPTARATRPVPVDTDARAGAEEGRTVGETPMESPREGTRPARSAGLVLWAVYLSGAMLLAARVALGWRQVRRFRREGEPVTDPEWTELLGALSARMGIAKSVALLRSRHVRVPLTWGTRVPVVMIPADADGWSADRRRAVLLHELAHVARRDSLTQTLGSLVTALYWIYPGVWWAARRLRVERELACDDAVLRAGTGAHEYAGHLLEIARHRWAPAPAAGLSMARPSELEARMLAILDPRRRRSAPARSTVGALAGAATALLVLVSTGAIAEGRAVPLSLAVEPRFPPAEAPAPSAAEPEPPAEEPGPADPTALPQPLQGSQDTASVVLVSRDGALRVVLERDAIRVRVTEDVYRQLTGESAAASAERGFTGFEPSGNAARYLASSVNRSIGLYNLRDVIYRDGSLILVRRDAPEPIELTPDRRGVYTIERMGLEPAQVEPFLRAARQRIALWGAVAGRVTTPGSDAEADLEAWAETVRAQASSAQAAIEIERAMAQQSRPGIMWNTIEPWIENEERRLSRESRQAVVDAFNQVKRAWRLLDAKRTLEPDLATLEASPQAQAFREAMERYIRLLEATP